MQTTYFTIRGTILDIRKKKAQGLIYGKVIVDIGENKFVPIYTHPLHTTALLTKYERGDHLIISGEMHIVKDYCTFWATEMLLLVKHFRVERAVADFKNIVATDSPQAIQNDLDTVCLILEKEGGE